MLKLDRKGIVLAPIYKHPWESKFVYNTAVIKPNSVIYLLYRAIGDDNISRIGLAASPNGIRFARVNEPIFYPQLPEEARGTEDPRIVRIGDTFYLTYTAYSEAGIKVGLAKTKNFIDWERCKIYNCNKYNRNTVLFSEKIDSKYISLHRPFDGHWTTHKGYGIRIMYSENMLTWNNGKDIMLPEQEWEHTKIGAGAPPIKTEEGWLLFYHGVNDNHEYRLGVAMLDLKNPDKVIWRQKEPILEPKENYEMKGNVPNVVFTCGACEMNNEYYVYYGGADAVVALATIEKEKVMIEAKRGTEYAK